MGKKVFLKGQSRTQSPTCAFKVYRHTHTCSQTSTHTHKTGGFTHQVHTLVTAHVWCPSAAEKRNVRDTDAEEDDNNRGGILSGHHLVLAMLISGWWALNHCLAWYRIMNARLHGRMRFTVLRITDGRAVNAGDGKASIWRG